MIEIGKFVLSWLRVSNLRIDAIVGTLHFGRTKNGRPLVHDVPVDLWVLCFAVCDSSGTLRSQHCSGSTNLRC